MRTRTISLLLTAGVVASLFAGNSEAVAQLNNKPYAFKGSPNGGVGMSIGGMQAIINQKVLGVTPDNLVRAPNGVLLDVTKGPNNVAITSNEGGGFIPGYKGTGFRGDNAGMSAGAFNAYFVPGNASGGAGDGTYGHVHSGAIVSSWTGRVMSGAGVSYLPSSSVDSWTGSVFQ